MQTANTFIVEGDSDCTIRWVEEKIWVRWRLASVFNGLKDLFEGWQLIFSHFLREANLVVYLLEKVVHYPVLVIRHVDALEFRALGPCRLSLYFLVETSPSQTTFAACIF